MFKSFGSLLCIACIGLTLLNIAVAAEESSLDLGFKLKLQDSSVLWQEGLSVNATCVATCNGCSDCQRLSYKFRNKTYSANVLKEFTMNPIMNSTLAFSRQCKVNQTVTFHNIKKNESGPVSCISYTNAALSGIAYLAVLYNVTFDNYTVPTTSMPVEVTNENGVKITVDRRVFNITEKPFLQCSTTSGSSGTEFHWKKEGDVSLTAADNVEEKRIPKTGTNPSSLVQSKLTFNKISEKAETNVGQYVCSISTTVNGAPVLSIAPIVTLADKDYRSGMEKDSYRQKCTVISYPKAVITWYKENKTSKIVPDAEGRIKLEKDNSELVISRLERSDRGVYICSAENIHGVGEAYIQLRVKDRLAALWPFLGIVAEVIVLVVIILLYEKKRANKKRLDDAQDAAEAKDDRNANDSEVRHRPVKT